MLVNKPLRNCLGLMFIHFSSWLIVPVSGGENKRIGKSFRGTGRCFNWWLNKLILGKNTFNNYAVRAFLICKFTVHQTSNYFSIYVRPQLRWSTVHLSAQQTPTIGTPDVILFLILTSTTTAQDGQ